MFIICGEIDLVVAKRGIDVGSANSIILPMIGTMTIVTTFTAPHVIKYGKFTEKFSNTQDKNDENQNQIYHSTKSGEGSNKPK